MISLSAPFSMILIPMIAGAGMRIVSVPIARARMPSARDKPVGIVRSDEPCVT